MLIVFLHWEEAGLPTQGGQGGIYQEGGRVHHTQGYPFPACFPTQIGSRKSEGRLGASVDLRCIPLGYASLCTTWYIPPGYASQCTPCGIPGYTSLQNHVPPSGHIYQRSDGRRRRISHFLDQFNQKWLRNKGTLGSSSGREKAGCILEGGLSTIPEGLRDYGWPCAQRLSVAELLTILGLFPGWRRLFPEEKRGSFPLAGASLLQQRE